MRFAAYSHLVWASPPQILGYHSDFGQKALNYSPVNLPHCDINCLQVFRMLNSLQTTDPPNAQEPKLLYNIHELQRAWLNGASALASVVAETMSHPAVPFSGGKIGSVVTSALEVFAHAAMSRGKPEFDIETVTVDGHHWAVTEAIVAHRPYGNLLRFTHDGLPKDAPKLLIVAPMSGHYATLLRGTVARMLEHSEVYITDWADARMVPISAGRFDLDDYIDYVINFLEHIGPGTHMLAVCQPSVPSLAATAIMAEGQTCVDAGGGGGPALAWSNGTIWKCF